MLVNHVHFSIIIPTYNRALKIEAILFCLIDQTFNDFEVIVCDDGSTDSTEDVVKGFKDRLNIKYFKIPNSGSPAKPRNMGLDLAIGEWICFLDSDDLWSFDKLEVINLYTKDFDFIYHNLFVTKDNEFTDRVTKSRQANSNPFLDLLVNRNFINNSSVAVRKTIIESVGRFREENEFAAIEDYDMWIRIGQVSNRFKFISKPLGNYNFDGYNITSNYSERNEKEIFIFNTYSHLIPDRFLSEAKAKLYWTIAVNYILDKNFLYIKYLFLVVKYANFKLKLFAFFNLFFGYYLLRKKI